MKSRKLGIGLLLLALVVTTGSFAYWASGVTGNSDTTAASVTIGSGNAVTTTVAVADLADLSALIPTAYGTPGTDDTAALTLPVLWTATAGGAGATGTLSVTLDSYTLGTLTEGEIDAMFTITVTSGTGAITEGVSQDVVITILFGTEPATQAIYDEVAAGNLVLNYTFTVTP